jgi:hypothetical protein
MSDLLTTSERDQLLDAQAALALLRLMVVRACSEGSNVLAIEAIEQALTPPPADGPHQVVFPERVKFLLRHPDGCDPGQCPVTASAARTLTLDGYHPGIYEAWVGADGWLCTTDVTP